MAPSVYGPGKGKRHGCAREPDTETERPKLRSWHEAFTVLLSYRTRHGDCRVPNGWPKNRWLASWVERMRAAKKQNLLTEAKIEALDQIGFIWSINPRHSWAQRFEELEVFKKRYGHCNVPKSYPLNRQLAYWVEKLRSLQRKGKLDRKAIHRLNELGSLVLAAPPSPSPGLGRIVAFLHGFQGETTWTLRFSRRPWMCGQRPCELGARGAKEQEARTTRSPTYPATG